MSEPNGSSAVPGVLARMDRDARRVRLAVLAAAAIEGLLLIIALWRIDWRNDTHVLLFVVSVLGYTIIVLGLAALGAHVSRVGSRVVAALEHRSVA